MWILDDTDKLTGIWIDEELQHSEIRNETVRMALADLVRKDGNTVVEDELSSAIYNGKWQWTPNSILSISQGNTIKGGAFLMVGENIAPNSVKDPARTFEIRIIGGFPRIKQIAPTEKRTPSVFGKLFVFWLVGFIALILFGLANLLLAFFFDVEYVLKKFMGSSSEIAILATAIPFAIGIALWFAFKLMASSK